VTSGAPLIVTEGLRRARGAVTAAYAAQGLGYAVIVTSLPALKERQGVDDTIVTILVLGVAILAAGGSVLANLVAVRAGSRPALALGLVLQGLALPLIAIPTPVPLFVAAFALFGVGLGRVDAAAAMQGVALQRAYGRPLLGGFFAALTAAAIAGALLVSLVSASALAAGVALATAGVVALVIGAAGSRMFAVEGADGLDGVDAAAKASEPRERVRLPRAGIWAFGFVILAAFVVDSAVSTWSTVYLYDGLAAVPWLAPLGYAAYQAAVLATRLVTDHLLPPLGPRRLVTIAVVLSVAGCVVVALAPVPGLAVVGFTLAGVATGVLVPVAFGAAGDLDPAHSDQVIARVNLFNYAGAILGAVAVGVVAEGTGLGLAFLLPAVVLAAVLFVVPRFGARANAPTAAAASPR
jgi:MFS family permease